MARGCGCADEEAVAAACAREAEDAAARLGRRFGRAEARGHAADYLRGLLAEVERKNGWQLAERVGYAHPRGIQRVLDRYAWDADAVRDDLRAYVVAELGDPRAVLVVDETGFPKQGTRSAGVARQYCGALGKVANCQVAVTAALWAGQRAWPMGALLYLPEAWTTDPARRASAQIPATVQFQEKWRLALTLVRRTRAAGVMPTAVVADAEYGDNTTVRQTLHRLRLPYAVGISPTLTMFRGTPTLRIDRTQPRPRNRRDGWPNQEPVAVRALSEALTPRAWRRVTWRNGTNPPWEADFAALRVTPATDWRRRRLAPEVWLLCERGLGPTGRRKHYLVSLPATASLAQLVRLAHQRWAIEQHYQDLKTELGLDHFEGRTYPGWQHHLVISAVAYAFVQRERMRPREGPPLTFPQVRAFVQEIFTGLLFISRPRYMRWMKQAEHRFRQLRI